MKSRANPLEFEITPDESELSFVYHLFYYVGHSDNLAIGMSGREIYCHIVVAWEMFRRCTTAHSLQTPFQCNLHVTKHLVCIRTLFYNGSRLGPYVALLQDTGLGCLY